MTIATTGDVHAVPTTQPTGASLAFTTDDPVTKQALAMLNQGKFAEANALLAAQHGHANATAAQARTELSEIIRRTRRDYSANAGDVLKKIQLSIPDAAPADVERWRTEGLLQHRSIEGAIAYFRREPVNLFRFSDDARQRREAAGKAPTLKKFALNEHLAKIVAEADETGETQVAPVRHQVTFTATIAPNAPGAKAGALVRCWLPFPQEYRQQRDVELLRSSPPGAKVAPNAAGDTHITGAAQRSVYFEQRVVDPSKSITFEVEFAYTSFAYYPKLDAPPASPASAGGDFSAYLDQRPPHIVFTPEIRRAVEKTAGAETNLLARARKIFHFIDKEIRYYGEEEYSTIPALRRRPSPAAKATAACRRCSSSRCAAPLEFPRAGSRAGRPSRAK